MGGAKELKPQASSSLGAWWLPWWLSLRGTDEKKQNRKYHKSLMRQTPKNPPVQKGSAFSTKLGIVNSKQRASNLTDPYQKKKKKKKNQTRSIYQTSQPGRPQATSLQELTIRKFSLLRRRDSKNRAVRTVKVSKFPHKSDTDLPLPNLCQKLRCH